MNIKDVETILLCFVIHCRQGDVNKQGFVILKAGLKFTKCRSTEQKQLHQKSKGVRKKKRTERGLMC